MNPLTVNPAIAVPHVWRQARDEESVSLRRSGRDRAVRAARSARLALERAGR
jgi:hypothetical protein